MTKRRNTFIRALLLAMLVAAPVAAQQTPFNGTIPIPGLLEAENFDNGGNGVAWSDTTAGNVFGAYRATDMDIGAIPAGGNHIGFLAGGEWAEYTVNVGTTGTYTVTLRWASDYAGATSFKVYQNGALVTPVPIPVEKTSLTTGDWHRYLTKTFSVTLNAGVSILKVEFTTGAWNFDSLTFAQQTCAAPTIQPLSPSSTTLNTPGVTWTLPATVSGATSYQWFKDGSAISGQTTSTLTILNAEEGKDVGDYTLRATSSCGTTTTSTVARLFRVRCSASPGHASENLYRALAPLPDRCYWQEDKHDGFVNQGTDVMGSFNKPVIAGAVAYIKGYAGYDVWWDKYLNGELGKPGGAANWVYGGNEIGSFTYQHFNTISVMAVALHAHRTGAIARRDLALEWLRNTFTINALIAAPTNMLTMHAQGQYRSGNAYNGPFIAMAGERSSYVNWDTNDRSILFSRAVGFSQNGQGETYGVRDTRQYIEAVWPLASPSAYGLTSTQQTALRNIVNTGTLPANLFSNYLTSTLRTKMPYHIVAWQNPVVRLTLMERNNHTFTAPTFGAVYFTNPKDAGGREVHLLWPWSGLWTNENYKDAITFGTGTINLQGGLIEAEQPGNATHPYMKVTISGLPLAGDRKYWIKLSPTAPPALQ